MPIDSKPSPRRVLVTGANGFIGAAVTAALIGRGHQVVAAVRDPARLRRRFPTADAIACDFNRDVTPAAWASRLDRVDAIINCAGVLQASRQQSIEAIHHRAPAALFDAARDAGVARVIQISAISADPAAGTEYAITKAAADRHLRALDIDWVVLRPSLVHAAGSYGGTSLLRALAALPFVVPLVGRGDQTFQPIHADDLARAVLVALEDPALVRRTLDPTGPETLTLREILEALRAWLGYRPARFLEIPLPVVALACRIGDLLAAGPLRTTSLKQIQFGNAGDPAAFARAIGFTPRSLAACLAATPAGEQERWHARLYPRRPLVSASLAVTWLASGALGLIAPEAATARVLGGLGLPAGWAGLTAVSASAIDLLLAMGIALGWRRGRLAAVQFLMVIGYTLVLSVAEPSLWLDPYGPLLKNLPILALIAVWAALDERP